MAITNRENRRYILLNLVHHFGPISRKKLIYLTDYRPASVSELTKELLEEGLLVETGHFSTGHGRKRVLLDINKDRLCAIGIGFSAASVTYIVAQFNGVILQRLETQMPAEMSKQELEDEILRQTKTLIAEFPEKEVVGIGLSEPLYHLLSYWNESILDLAYTHFNDWIRGALRQRMEQEMHLHVDTFSAVTLPALAEQRFGAAKGVNNFFCVELSNGIGCSIFCNGRVVSGANGVAGELGHTVVDTIEPDAAPCYCGKPGCVEQRASFPALEQNIRAALDRGVSSLLQTDYQRGKPLSVQQIREALDHGDRLCRHYVGLMAQRLGIAIANAVNLLNPELVVLYGFMVELGDFFLERLETAIRENTLVLSNQFAIRVSRSLEQILPLGAIGELFSSYLKINEYQWIYDLQASELDMDAEADSDVENDQGETEL